jgi:hypothetical protein
MNCCDGPCHQGLDCPVRKVKPYPAVPADIDPVPRDQRPLKRVDDQSHPPMCPPPPKRSPLAPTPPQVKARLGATASSACNDGAAEAAQLGAPSTTSLCAPPDALGASAVVGVPCAASPAHVHRAVHTPLVAPQKLSSPHASGRSGLTESVHGRL